MTRLRVLSGHLEGQTFALGDSDLSIGRAPDNTITLDDPAVSGHHCVIVRDKDHFTIRDLDSTNTTLLNEVSITEFRLNPGDTIKIGDVRILFDDESMPGVATPQPTPPVKLAETEPPVARTTRFGTRHDSRWPWILATGAVAMLALAALTWFLFRLFRS